MRSEPKPSLSLRPWQIDDADDLVAAWNDPAVAAGASVPQDRSHRAAQRWISGCGERERRLLAIDRVIDVDGRLVGEVGISSIDQRRQAALMGWWIMAPYRRHGYATAAVAQMLAMIFDPRHVAGVSTVLAEIGPDNEASRQVAQRSGFVILRDAATSGNTVFVARAANSTDHPVARDGEPR